MVTLGSVMIEVKLCWKWKLVDIGIISDQNQSPMVFTSLSI